MKAKSPIAAARTGKARRAAVKAGDAVEAGHVLVKIG